ncbi:MAG: TatA/E family twin arginine-targeting protein translocase [Cyanobacteria bacterium P01_E01_bin.6]
MNIFGIGLPEMALIFIVALLIFGPKKLPEIGKSLGKAMKSFQDASKEFETEFKREAEQIQNVVKEPMQAVLDSPKAIASSENDAKEGEIEEEMDGIEVTDDVDDSDTPDTAESAPVEVASKD